MYSDRRVLLSVAQKIEQFATSCVWQNFHWNTVKHKLHRVYILFFVISSRVSTLDYEKVKISSSPFSIWTPVLDTAHVILWTLRHWSSDEWLLVTTELSALFSVQLHLICPAVVTTSSLALVNTLSRLSGDVMWTSWTISAWRACFPRGAWCDAPSSDEHMLDTHFSADVPHSCMHNIAYKSSTTRYRSFRKRSSEPITLGDTEKTKPNTNKSNNTKTKSSKLMLKNTKH